MGALPKRKISKGRKNRRRAQDRLSKPALSACPKCGKPKRPHFVCQSCGHYGAKPEPKKAATTKKAPAKAKKSTAKKSTKK